LKRLLGRTRILGVDPGLLVTGYAVIEIPEGRFENGEIDLIEAGVVRAGGPRDGIAARLKKIYDSLAELISETRPNAVVIEKLYAHYKHPATAILMGHARGVVCLLSGTHRVPLHNMASTHVKKAVTGAGHASKEQVQRMTQSILGLKNLPEPADAADAIAIALAFAFNRNTRSNFLKKKVLG